MTAARAAAAGARVADVHGIHGGLGVRPNADDVAERHGHGRSVDGNDDGVPRGCLIRTSTILEQMSDGLSGRVGIDDDADGQKLTRGGRATALTPDHPSGAIRVDRTGVARTPIACGGRNLRQPHHRQDGGDDRRDACHERVGHTTPPFLGSRGWLEPGLTLNPTLRGATYSRGVLGVEPRRCAVRRTGALKGATLMADAHADPSGPRNSVRRTVRGPKHGTRWTPCVHRSAGHAPQRYARCRVPGAYPTTKHEGTVRASLPTRKPNQAVSAPTPGRRSDPRKGRPHRAGTT